MSELPTGTVTFLFTDLESSTRLWEQDPEAMRDALAEHDALLRRAVEAHHGDVVKGTGDGLHAVFATADTAVSAAVEGQQALRGASWGPVGALRVRMGLHTGVAEQRADDYFGPVLNRAARSGGGRASGAGVVLASDGRPDAGLPTTVLWPHGAGSSSAAGSEPTRGRVPGPARRTACGLPSAANARRVPRQLADGAHAFDRTLERAGATGRACSRSIGS